MTTIVVTHEDNEVDQFTFDAADRVISIGRRSTNDVCIPNLSVSGVHARIAIDGSSVSIEDNNSTNGTYVNGRLISRQLINDNDEIMIGRSSVMVQLSREQIQAAVAQAEQAQAEQVQAEQANAQQVQDANPAAELAPPVLNSDPQADNNVDNNIAQDMHDDFDNDDSFVNESFPVNEPDQFDDRPMSLSEKAKLALGREGGRQGGRDPSPQRPNLNGVNGVAAAGAAAVAGTAAMAASTTSSASAAASRAFANDSDVAVAEAPVQAPPQVDDHPLEGINEQVVADELADVSAPIDTDVGADTQISKPAGAVIEIQNGAKSGQVLPIDKPVTTLGRPGIQIAAIMRKPDGYFLMHIESDGSIDMPTLNRDSIGDDPVMLQSGDRLNVAGIDVEFMLS